MIIQCKSCLCCFRLDETLLKSGGSRVRCSKCREVFVAYQPGNQPGSPERAFVSVGAINRRRSSRFPVAIPAICSCIDQNGKQSDVHIGTIKQVSREGAAIEIFQCSLSQALNISFIGDSNKDIQVIGKVRHSTTDERCRMRIGLSLEGAPSQVNHFYLQAMRSNKDQDSHNNAN